MFAWGPQQSLRSILYKLTFLFLIKMVLCQMLEWGEIESHFTQHDFQFFYTYVKEVFLLFPLGSS
ncbi:hypothetical protein JOC94_002150 [Bacillus thermophilus]|uniref:Uncharacterized protein n=1 Tax=Siminovitchia thermophila TaxID=1245522 RepID=A0ABS2R6D7_9BACI|nr:hypothetical protein [Siminovitchia thermophila]